MRHYYDVYCLLQDADTVKFIGTPEYLAHKEKRFRTADNPVIAENEAFLLQDKETRDWYKSAYQSTRALYYRSQPDFDEILKTIEEYAQSL